MAVDKDQFRDLVIRTLNEIDLHSDDAVALLLGTAAVESAFGTYLRQKSGPALGAFQVEYQTFEWLRGKYQSQYPTLRDRKFVELEWDLRLSIITARLRYRVRPEALPAADNVFHQAEYWKQFYNTSRGKGTAMHYVHAYRKYVYA